MPKVRMGNVGDFQTIPFDEHAIAELMDRGYSVYPDDGIDENLYREQDNLVRGAINIRVARDQWGEKKFAPERKRLTLRGARSLREDDPFSKRIQSPGSEISSDYLNIKPNPFITNMPEIDPNYLMDPEKKKKSWEL